MKILEDFMFLKDDTPKYVVLTQCGNSILTRGGTVAGAEMKHNYPYPLITQLEGHFGILKRRADAELVIFYITISENSFP
jgi:hypothetical protein